MSPRICVIGAGPSGLTTAKNLIEQGIGQVVVFEKSAEVGGNWVFREDNAHSSVYETTHLISSKKLSSYEDYPMPATYPDYPSHRQMLAYFQAYARAFGVMENICFNTTVLEASRGASGEWRILYRDHAGTHQAHFDYLFVCNGHHWSPQMPHIPGQFSGQLLHAHTYKRAAPFAGQRLLVIGGGNSACDIATELSRVGARTCISLRRGYYILPKFMFGKPVDLVAARFRWLPNVVRQYLVKLTLRLFQGDYRAYGLQQPSCGPYEMHPTINSELLYLIRHGRIVPKVGIERFEDHHVRFSDGSREPFDTVLCATGYRVAFPFFDASLIDFSGALELPLYHKMIHADYENLFFIGLLQPQGSVWPLADYQARLAARQILGTWKRPKDLRERIARQCAAPHFRYEKTLRHALEVDFHRYRKELLRELKSQR